MDKQRLASDEQVLQTEGALKANGFNVFVVNTKEEAKDKLFSLIPEKSEVMQMTSVTLDTLGVGEILSKSGKYIALRDKLYSLNRETHAKEMNIIGSAPEYALGSVHAITEDGHLYIASNTGSQLPAYAYGASNVIWVVGTNKLVKTHEDAMSRLSDHVLPLESERAKKAYGVPGSFISKLLIINKEINPKRANVILVRESLGF